MSGPISNVPSENAGMGLSAIEVREGRQANIGAMGIVRILPTKGRRTIGPWCFVDLMKPDDVEKPPKLEVGPHPHIGLATVTWLFEGSVTHTDSLGTEQLIRPGQLNLMTAGHGIAHAEEGVETARVVADSDVMGVQMWLAQTDATRHADSAFQHLDQVPLADFRSATAQVLVGEVDDARSPAAVDHPTVALDIRVAPSVVLPTVPSFEYGVVPIDRPLLVRDSIVEPGSLALVAPGFDTLPIEVRGGTARVMVIGGEPLGTTLQMWWNFVARTQDEITDAWRDWNNRNDDRFGPVLSTLDRFEAPRPPWVPPEG